MSDDSPFDPYAGYYAEPAATFGDRLAAAREAAGLSQGDLAERLGVRVKTLRGWENDLAEPRANRLQVLAGLLDVSMVWLLTGEGEGVPPPGLPVASTDLAALRSDLARLRQHAEALVNAIGALEDRIRKAGGATTP